ncbi:MAG: lipopolysaccharide kinase InaA family protein [Candidatus Bathyarchaeia archaeon]
MNYVKFFNGKPTVFYAVDGWVFEKDVEAGFLGEAFSIHLAFPYMPLKGSNYLKRCEIKLKKRLILELLENLVLDFPELSYVIHIKPEYFMYEALLSRARLFPPIYYDICSFLRREVQKQNLKKVMEGYNDALRELEREGIVKRVDLDLFKISKEFIEESRKRKALFTNLLRSAQKALFNSLLGTFPKVLRVLSERVDAILKFQFSENEWLKFRAEHTIKNPEAYLLVPTANGLIPLSATINIEDFANKIMKAGEKASVATEKLGGVLNDVYLVKVFGNDEERKVVVKSFKDWSSFKWFPLTLWTVGTRAFAVLGRSRLERECSINQFLHSKGFAVPKLLSVSHSQKLVFLEYLEGETLDKVIKKIYSLGAEGEIQKELEIIRKVGEIIAKVHALNVALGDTKPENVLVGKNGEIFLMDFEQASRNGDKTWDVAEILYYLGHYAPPFTETRLIEIAAQAFIKGYLEAGGNLKTVKAAGKPKYTKVFSVFVFPHIILAISNICQNAESIKG